jgi:hypothetical protein
LKISEGLVEVLEGFAAFDQLGDFPYVDICHSQKNVFIPKIQLLYDGEHILD